MVSVLSVSLEDELMVISQQGIAIRMPVKDLSQIGRNTQGVILMRLDKDDRVVAAAKIAKENNKV